VALGLHGMQYVNRVLGLSHRVSGGFSDTGPAQDLTLGEIYVFDA